MNRNHHDALLSRLEGAKRCKRANGTRHRSAFAAASSILTACLLTVLLAACPSSTSNGSNDDAAPGAPTAVTATAGDTKVTVAWTAPTNTGYTGGDGTKGVITKYTVYHSESTITDPTATGVTAVEVTGATTLTKEVTGLTNGTEYFFKVTATNATGESAASEEQSATPAVPVPGDAAPGAPTGVSATEGNAQVTVAWTAPTDTGYISGDGTKGVITKYTVYHSETNDFTDLTAAGVTAVDAGTALTTDVTGLTNGTQYHFVVTATNATGEGAASTATSATPAAPPADAAPGAPTGVSATAGNAQVTVAWTAPTDTGYISGDGTMGVITKYTVYYHTATFDDTSLPATKVETADGDTTTADVTGLTNSTQYFFRVTATNATGDSVVSDEETATPAIPADAAPGAPTAVTPTAGNKEVTVSWTAPTDTGYISGDGTMGVITKYTVYYATATIDTANLPTDKVDTADGTTTTADVTGLTGGTQYYFVVTATNATDEGAASDEVSTYANAVPEAPTIGATTAGDEQITVAWTAPAGNGFINGDGTAGSITGYTVYYDDANIDAASLPATMVDVTDGTATDAIVTGLTNGTTYYFKVAAKNAAGEGPLSGEATGDPVDDVTAPTFTLSAISAATGVTTLTITADEAITLLGADAAANIGKLTVTNDAGGTPSGVNITGVALGADEMTVTITIDSTDFTASQDVKVDIAADFAADKAAGTANNNVAAALTVTVQ